MAEADNVMAPVERLVMMVPYSSTPLGRATVFGGMGLAYAWAVKPSMSFFDSGKPRPWILFDSSNPDAAVFPYWAWGVVPAVIFGVLI